MSFRGNQPEVESRRNIVHSLRAIDKRWHRRLRPHVRRVLVDCRTAMNYATLAPIIQRLQRDLRIRFLFTASDDYSNVNTIYSEAPKPFQIVNPIAAALGRFDAYLAADFLWVTLPRGTQRIQTFHGVAGKYRTVYDSPSQSMRSWDRLYFINRRRLEHFVNCGAIDENSPAACLIGMPKLDCLVDGSLNRDTILRSLGVDPSRKTVLYAPTWSPYSSLGSFGEELVQKLGAAGYAVIVKLHDRSRESEYIHSGGVDWGARLNPILQRFGGVLAQASDSSKYLAAADVLITDHSSVGFEYLLLDRPVIRIEVPELIRRTDIEPTYVQLLAEASTTTLNVEDTLTAVERGMQNPQLKSDSRQAVVREMFYKPGTATERAVSNMYEVLELDSPEQQQPSPTGGGFRSMMILPFLFFVFSLV